MLVLGEEMQPGFEQRLQFGILGRRDEQRAEGRIDSLMLDDFVVEVGFVKGRTIELV